MMMIQTRTDLIFHRTMLMKTLVLLIKVYRMRPLLGLSDEPHCWRIPYVLQNFNAQARVKKSKILFWLSYWTQWLQVHRKPTGTHFFPEKVENLSEFHHHPFGLQDGASGKGENHMHEQSTGEDLVSGYSIFFLIAWSCPAVSWKYF